MQLNLLEITPGFKPFTEKKSVELTFSWNFLLPKKRDRINRVLKSYLQLILLKKEKTIHSKTLFTIPVDLKST